MTWRVCVCVCALAYQMNSVLLRHKSHNKSSKADGMQSENWRSKPVSVPVFAVALLYIQRQVLLPEKYGIVSV